MTAMSKNLNFTEKLIQEIRKERQQGDSINVNIGDYHFIYKCKPSEDANNNN